MESAITEYYDEEDRCRLSCEEAYDHQGVPEYIIALAGKYSLNPWFWSMLNILFLAAFRFTTRYVNINASEKPVAQENLPSLVDYE